VTACPVADTLEPPASRLPDLVALAREPSSDKRRALLRELTDHFFGAPRHGPEELALFDDLLQTLTTEMEVVVRAELARRFSESLTAPPGLIRRLAFDEAEIVSTPVLRRASALAEPDQLALAEQKGQPHLRALSQRDQVSEAVADVIVSRGDDQTLDTLLRNDGAKLSRRASEAAVERAKANPDLQQAVVDRRALPPDLLNEMYFVVEARLRRKILEKNALLSPTQLEAALQVGRARVAGDDGILPPDYAESLAYIEELRAAGQLTPPILARFLRSGSRTSFLIALAQMTEMDFHTVERIVQQQELDALTVLCRAADLDRSLFLTYAVAILKADDNAMAKAHVYARHYMELDREAALRTLRFWRLRRSSAV